MDVVYTVPAAIALGALHALEPGHGKGVISAYLVATHGKIRDALLIGVISAVTHTFSIIMLAFIASSALHRYIPEKTTGWIELFAGLLIVMIGAKLMYNHFYPRMLSVGKLSGIRHLGSHHGHDHGGGFHHHPPEDEAPNSLHRLIAVGVLTGIIPCPSAVAIFLAALTAKQISLGVGLVGAFSLGNAISMCAVGVLVVRIGNLINRQGKPGFVRSLQYASSYLILGIGLYVVLQSVRNFQV